MHRTADASDLELAEILWNYHRLGRAPRPADAMLVLGGPDVRVAERGAELFHAGFAQTVVCTGGVAHQDDLLATGWDAPEADVFAEVLINKGVPRDRVWLERCATNTGENLRFARDLLREREIEPANVILVVKPAMERRAVATADVVWPEVDVVAASPAIPLRDYPTVHTPIETVIQIIVGDLQRIWVYAERGFQSPQAVPDEVLAAFAALVQRGYDRHCLRREPMRPEG